MIAQSCQSDGQHSADLETLLVDLLVRFEEIQEGGQRSTAQEFLKSDPQLAALADLDGLAEELEQRCLKLQSVDEVLLSEDAGASDVRLPSIPGYQILKELDRGGMGVVYLARQTVLERPVAIKVLGAGQFASSMARQRFRREAATVARLRHPNIVEIYDRGEVDGLPFFALEWIEGGSLKSRVAGNPLSCREAATIVEKLAQAVHHAHQQGVIHRDLKPSNVLLSVHGIPKVADFGLAKLLEQEADLTSSGDALGTPRYMAPEQISAGEVGPQTDVYALGAILYEVLTGRPAFSTESGPHLATQVLHEDPPPPSRHQAGVPRDLDAICQKCLEKASIARYATAGELADDLKRYLLGEPIVARRHGALAYGLKWARRHPAVASLLVLASLLILALYGATLLHSRQLKAALTQSQENYQRAVENEQALQRREQALTEQQYAMRMRAADDMIRNFNARTALAELSHYDVQQPDANVRGFEWYLLRQWCEQSVATVDAHTDRINTITPAPDDSTLATASDDGTIKLWDSRRHTLLGTITGHASCVNEAAYLPGGDRLVTASCDHTIRLWEARSAAEIATLVDIGRPAWWIAVSPDGIIATPAAESSVNLGEDQIALWDVETRILLKTGFGHPTKINSATFAPDGKQLVTANEDGSVRFWDVETGRQTRRLVGHVKSAFRVRFDASGKYFISVGADGYAVVWNTSNFKKHRTLRVAGMIYDASFSANSAVVALACTTGNTKLFDVETGRQTASLVGHSAGVRSVAFVNGSNQLVSGANASPAKLRFWRVDGASTTGVALSLPGSSVGAKFDEKLERAVVCVHGRELRQWDLDRRTSRAAVAVTARDGGTIEFSGLHNYIAAPSKAGNLTVWRANSTESAVSLGNGLTPIGGCITDGQPQLATWSRLDGEVPVWQIEFWNINDWSMDEKALKFRLPGQDRSLAFAVDPGGEVVAVASDSVVRVYSRSSGDIIRITAAPCWKTSICFSRDGKTLLWGNDMGHFSRWTWSTHGQPVSHQAHLGIVHSVAISPDGKTIATGDGRGNVKLSQTNSGQPMLQLKALDAPVLTLAWSEDGTALACFCRENGGLSRAEIRRWTIDHSRIE